MKTEAIVDLTGSWRLAKVQGADLSEGGSAPAAEGLEWMDAAVPGAVHYELVKHGKLTNPFESTEAAFAAEWVAQSDWVYVKTFSFHAGDSADQYLYALKFDGIDTFSDIWLNGQRIGQTANAYRSYQFEVPSAMLKPEGNELLVHVKSHYRMIEGKIPAAEQMARTGSPSGLLGKSLIRRYQRSFFTNSSLLNLGTGVLGIGVHKPVSLLRYPKTRIAESYFAAETMTEQEASAFVEIKLVKEAGASQALKVEATLWEAEAGAGKPAASAVETVYGDSVTLPLRIGQPKLWWPRGYGRQNLYRLMIRVYDGDTLLHETEKKVGLKRVEVVRELPNGRKTFFIRVNGRKIHARGSNLIPVDYLKVHDTWDAYERLFWIMHNSNHNMLRIWGGGAVETDAFYDRCDELGIMIWQDFFLHSNVYPDYDPEFVEEFRLESVELVKRIRDRASLGILCGGNEQMEGWDEWNWKAEMDRFYGEPLIAGLLPDIAQKLCPEIPYVINSPHGGKMAQSAVEGDMHNWGNFYNATKDPQFVTETCWNLESYSRPETLKASMGLDVEEFTERGWHKQWKERTSIALLTKFPYSAYHNVATLRDYLRALEIEQSQADYHALSMLRLRSSSCSGILYWSLNKGGPLFGFGCVDYKGYPLMSYYAVKKVFSDTLIGVYRDVDDIRIVASNLTAEPLHGEIRITHMNADGADLKRWQIPVSVQPDFTGNVFDIASYYSEIADRTREIVHVEWLVDGSVISDDTLYFCTIAEFAAASEPVSATAAPSGPASWTLELETASVSKMVLLESNQKLLFSDNYFTLVPGVKKRIDVTLLEQTGGDEVLLTAASLDAEQYSQRLVLQM
ncbi:beta-mannosidase [Paenibacillus thalictri]|uniref:Beta-mannosidase B n=1 Tax=Paenibacillus thalictri TaxID=2527873 RepID=A0A4Q9DSP8_9BACL|nr:glycoside hydrolase family 2 protein [Paenibacillus thalictri]TBL79889.1 beta-mannosidase [Paenibacillus thalictri]